MDKPKDIFPVYGGWHAAGEGWAVFGKTREEAIEKFKIAAKRHEELLAMPPWHMRTPEQKEAANRDYQEWKAAHE